MTIMRLRRIALTIATPLKMTLFAWDFSVLSKNNRNKQHIFRSAKVNANLFAHT